MRRVVPSTSVTDFARIKESMVLFASISLHRVYDRAFSCACVADDTNDAAAGAQRALLALSNRPVRLLLAAQGESPESSSSAAGLAYSMLFSSTLVTIDRFAFKVRCRKILRSTSRRLRVNGLQRLA
ncbi:hypothetical protein KC325_g11 [Hortaea werneckii]|nr:hypothetical protein KC325_g11 [Hortaea werneckii]